LAGRLSALKSDGYIDRASSDLKSYFLQGTYVGKTTLIKALAFGGKEKPINPGMVSMQKQ
jgi:iron complex outermembrane receptor protein